MQLEVHESLASFLNGTLDTFPSAGVTLVLFDRHLYEAISVLTNPTARALHRLDQCDTVLVEDLFTLQMLIAGWGLEQRSERSLDRAPRGMVVVGLMGLFEAYALAVGRSAELSEEHLLEGGFRFRFLQFNGRTLLFILQSMVVVPVRMVEFSLTPLACVVPLEPVAHPSALGALTPHQTTTMGHIIQRVQLPNVKDFPPKTHLYV